MRKHIEIRPHARKQINERNIPDEIVKDILHYPGQVLDSYHNRKIAQDVITHHKEQFLIRVVFEEHKDRIEVVTVYLTKKIQKCWEGRYAH